MIYRHFFLIGHTQSWQHIHFRRDRKRSCRLFLHRLLVCVSFLSWIIFLVPHLMLKLSRTAVLLEELSGKAVEIVLAEVPEAFFRDERILCADGSTFCLRPWGECTCARIFKRVGEGVACWGGNAARCWWTAACCRGNSVCLGGSTAKIFLLLLDLLVHLLLHKTMM